MGAACGRPLLLVEACVLSKVGVDGHVGRELVDVFAKGRGTDQETLIWLGERLDQRLEDGSASTVRELLAPMLLKIRDKQGRVRALELNEAQAKFEADCGKKNIILKARQLGMTTWVAARFLLNTITRPGTLSVQVAHDRDSAEQIFRIVHRMVENLPPSVLGALKVSRANVRQIVFAGLDSEFRVETAADANAGRGLTIQNLHASEVARWPGDVDDTLAGLRAAVVPEGEVTLESTANGAWGAFYREWKRAEAGNGYVRHFFPWWMEPRYRIERSIDGDVEEMRSCGSARGASVSEVDRCLDGGMALSDEERDLCARWEMKAHMAWLVGNGNEGKMQELEQRIKRQEISLYRLGGVGAAVGGALTIVHLALDYMKVVHR
jgi:hypothetical protein